MGFNAKLFEIILYSDSSSVLLNDIDNFLNRRTAIKDWAYIRHDKDEGKKDHYHVAIRCKNGNNSEYVAKWFGVNENQVGKVKGKWSDILAYLTHANAPDKYQYADDEVKSNFDWMKERESGRKGDARLEEIVSMIDDEEIRQYNIHEKISMLEYTKYKRVIDTCFEYRAKKLKGMNRSMEVVYIQGESGCGKTTYAKELAEGKGYKPFISSGSNDILDGYEGEECIILDDLRPSSLGLSDLLKMLDNNTSSSVKSRYRNKILECRLIVITTVLPLEEFFKNVFENESEPIVQFKRRCRTLIKMDKDKMDYYFYMEKERDYVFMGSQPNAIYKQYVKGMTQDEALEMMKGILGGALDVVNFVQERKDEFVKVDDQVKLPFD